MRSFFKIIVSDIASASESKLIIPQKFVRSQEEKLPERVLLKTPVGAAWAVDVERKNGQTEINYPNLDHGKSVLQIRKRPTVNDDSGSCELIMPCKKTRASSASQEAFSDGLKLKQEKAIGDGVSASEEEKNRALASAKAFKSNKPFFIVSMKPSCVVGRSTNIPKTFQEIFGKWKNRNQVILHVAERSWVVDCILRGNICRLTSGWIHFIRDNTLHVCDVCVFELMDSSGKLFEVFIFPAKPEATTSSFLGVD